MGNEFGHPEWVDFPSERNDFSFHYARRQWSLKYDKDLYFSCLSEFDQQMISLAKDEDFFASTETRLLCIHEDDKVIAFERGSLVFAFNFHPDASFSDYTFEARPGQYQMKLNSDDPLFGGKDRLERDQVHFTRVVHPAESEERHLLSLYLPTRTALVLKQLIL
jgi:1,4-alpha-glucan branching enzyme